MIPECRVQGGCLFDSFLFLFFFSFFFQIQKAWDLLQKRLPPASSLWSPAAHPFIKLGSVQTSLWSPAAHPFIKLGSVQTSLWSPAAQFIKLGSVQTSLWKQWTSDFILLWTYLRWFIPDPVSKNVMAAVNQAFQSGPHVYMPFIERGLNSQ